MSAPATFLRRVVILAGILFLVIGLTANLADILFPVQSPTPALKPTDAPSAAAAWALVALLYSVVIAYPVVRSRWAGWRLVAAIFGAFYGITTVLNMIEVAFFMPHVISAGTIVRIMINHAIIAAVAAPAAVWLFDRWGSVPRVREANPRLHMSWQRWVWKLALIAVTYVFLYLFFGALVAWQVPAVREFYADAVIPTVGTIVLLQLLRALVWVALAVPIIRMMKGPWWETALAVALLFAVLMNAGLLAPNPFMPSVVRMTHLVETASSNFIFGWCLVWLLLRVKEGSTTAESRVLEAPSA
jgi:hypothetical protein